MENFGNTFNGQKEKRMSYYGPSFLLFPHLYNEDWGSRFFHLHGKRGDQSEFN